MYSSAATASSRLTVAGSIKGRNGALRRNTLDEALQPSGEAFELITRDLSNRGISLIHTQAVQIDHLAVQLTDFQGAKLNAIVKVLRCRAIGSYYVIAGQFVTQSSGASKKKARHKRVQPAL